jgi:hypothetical protein
MLEKLLKFNLKPRESQNYLQWLAERDQHREGHHILGKRNDYLIAKITSQEHKEVHAKTKNSLDFDQLLFNAIENLLDYVEFLEKPTPRTTLSEIQKDIQENNWEKYAISSKWYGQADKRETDAKNEMQRILRKLTEAQNG